MNMSYKNLKLIACGTFAAMLVAGFTSCGKKDANSPGFEFMPDMYRSPSAEYYGVHVINGDTVLTYNKTQIGGGFVGGKQDWEVAKMDKVDILDYLHLKINHLQFIVQM